MRAVIWPLAGLTFVNAIDRANLSFAAHAMEQDIHLSPTSFGTAVGAFFLAYLLFQYPHAALLRRFGIRRWLLCTVSLWGVAGLAMSRVNSLPELLTARFLLGVAEAGFAPGVTWYINRWFPQQARARAMAVVLSAVPASMVLGGPICGLILDAPHPAGLSPWRWMFVLQALPNFVLGLLAYAYFRDDVREMPGVPADTPVAEGGQNAEPANLGTFGPILRDARVWRCAFVWLFVMTGSYALLFWLPQLVRQMMPGGSETLIGTVSALPQAGLIAGMLLVGRHSDHTGERLWHMGISAVIAGVALLIGAFMPIGWGAMALLVLTGGAIGAAQAVFWAIPAHLGIGQGRVSVQAIALISMFGTGGGILGPMLIGVMKQATGGFAGALAVLALMLVAGGVLIMPLRSKDKIA
ncbi:ACS family tartrate transporter-like MFS transporter [Novosphingobium sp. SG751A]|uniref:MFS transporter n=1 Tax=Novosphingobium sp. SG751A TaxID=2587000 RepID=UPI001552754C|nr:MFS transporter [Novosphingobium sp. SG751A]NOW47973.1 ACS family tartrate transporter-like MFS transporter [Novosphingobium sp. SG751A]